MWAGKGQGQQVTGSVQHLWLPGATVMGRAEAATRAIKGRKNLGGGFGAGMKSSCELCSWLLSLAGRTGRGGRSERPAAMWGWGQAGGSSGTTGVESWPLAGGLVALVSSGDSQCLHWEWCKHGNHPLGSSGGDCSRTGQLVPLSCRLQLPAAAPCEPEPALPLLTPPWSCQGRQNPSSQSNRRVPRRCL